MTKWAYIGRGGYHDSSFYRSRETINFLVRYFLVSAFVLRLHHRDIAGDSHTCSTAHWIIYAIFECSKLWGLWDFDGDNAHRPSSFMQITNSAERGIHMNWNNLTRNAYYLCGIEKCIKKTITLWFSNLPSY